MKYKYKLTVKDKYDGDTLFTYKEWFKIDEETYNRLLCKPKEIEKYLNELNAEPDWALFFKVEEGVLLSVRYIVTDKKNNVLLNTDYIRPGHAFPPERLFPHGYDDKHYYF